MYMKQTHLLYMLKHKMGPNFILTFCFVCWHFLYIVCDKATILVVSILTVHETRILILFRLYFLLIKRGKDKPYRFYNVNANDCVDSGYSTLEQTGFCYDLFSWVPKQLLCLSVRLDNYHTP